MLLCLCPVRVRSEDQEAGRQALETLKEMRENEPVLAANKIGVTNRALETDRLDPKPSSTT